MALIAFYISLVISVGTLAWGFYEAGLNRAALGILGFGLLWLLACLRRWRWFTALGLFVTILTAAAGLWLGLAPGWMLVGAMGGLLAWDLDDFIRRLRLAAEVDDLTGLEHRHLIRLMILAVAGLTLASAAMYLRLRFTFAWAFFLVLVVALGVTRLVTWLRRGGG